MDVKTLRNSVANTVFSTRHFNPTTIRVESIVSKDGSTINISELDSNLSSINSRIAACETNDKTLFEEISAFDEAIENCNYRLDVHDEDITTLESKIETVNDTLIDVQDQSTKNKNNITINIIRARVKRESVIM